MWVDTDSNRDVVNFVVGKQAVALDFPGVEHFAAQGQDGLVFFVATHFGATTRGVPFDQKHFVVGRVFAFAIGQFTRQNCHARAFAFFNFLPCFLASLGGFDGEFGEFFAVFDVLIEPQF